MPNIDIIAILKISFKLLLVGIMLSLLLSYGVELRGLLTDLIQKITSSTSGLNNMNLGCVGEKLGFVSFMNSAVNTLWIAGHTLLSGVVVIFGFKYGIEIYKYLMKV